MLEVSAFRAVHYDFTRFNRDLSPLLAPPYDVLDESDKAALLARSDRNIVAIDLPHLPPKSLGPAEAYRRSADLLKTWLDDGTLVRDPAAALYLYHQRFTHEGRRYTRRMIIARVRLHPFEEGIVLPHERTFGGPKEDRLALMKATNCNLSPVFGLYTDPADRIGSAFGATVSRAPDATGTLDGVENLLWRVTDPAVLEGVGSLMAAKRLYIADGHHRYTTALNYRDALAASSGGTLPDDHPARYVMLVLASMDDPGCVILPYHRALGGVSLAQVEQAWSDATEPADEDHADLRLVDGQTGQTRALRYTSRDVLARLEPEQCAPWRLLDAAYLHRYLLEERLRASLGAEPHVFYVKSADDARDVARRERGVALLVNATPMAHLRAVSEAGGLMPQKSTYFYPKLATGLTIYPLE